MSFSLGKLFEPEEFVGELWHRFISRPTDLPRFPEAAVAFADVAPRLGVFFRALGGEVGVELKSHGAQASRARLGWKHRLGHAAFHVPRARFDGDTLLLPERIDALPSPELNRDLYYWLAAFAAAAQGSLPEPHADALRADIAALRHAWQVSRRALFIAPGLKARYRRLCHAAHAIRPERRLPMWEQQVEEAIRVMLAVADALPDEDALAANPALAAIIARDADLATLHAPCGYRPFLPVPVWGDAIARTPQEAREPRPDDQEPGSGKPPAAEDANRKWRAKRHKGDEAKRKDPLILHRFEAVISIAEFLNLARQVDASSEDDARKARDDVDEISLVDADRRPKTKLAFDLDLAPEDVDRERLSGEHLYPEWDYRKRTYMPDHCRVLTSTAEEAAGENIWQPDAAMRRRIRLVKRQFEALRPRRELLRRQLDGTELDTDAAVRSMCELRAHGEGSDHIWAQHRETARDLAVAVLFDTSRSMESWVDGRQVLDIARETLLALAAGLDACGDEHGIFAFSSTRNERVFVQTIKGFDERFGPRIHRRIAALKPGFYTRLGAAIRHVAQVLNQRPHNHRLLLVITDGKPNDLDHYEGRFGVEDTKMAVREARATGQKVFGVTIDAQARDWFTHMFGRNGHAIVSRPARLAQALPRLYRHLVM